MRHWRNAYAWRQIHEAIARDLLDPNASIKEVALKYNICVNSARSKHARVQRVLKTEGEAAALRSLEKIHLGRPVGKKNAGRDREKDPWLRQIIEVAGAMPQQIWSGPANGSTDWCNDRWLTEYGLTLEEIQGNGWQRVLHPDDRDRLLEAWRYAVTNGTPYEQEELRRTADGQYRWFLCRGIPLRDGERIVRWVGINTDIEKQKRAEDALRQQEQRWREIFDPRGIEEDRSPDPPPEEAGHEMWRFIP